MHDIVVVGIPLIAILAGILFNRGDVKELRSELHSLRSEMISRFDKVEERFKRMDDRFDRVDADLRQFHFITGKLDGRIDGIEKRT